MCYKLQNIVEIDHGGGILCLWIRTFNITMMPVLSKLICRFDISVKSPKAFFNRNQQGNSKICVEIQSV